MHGSIAVRGPVAEHRPRVLAPGVREMTNAGDQRDDDDSARRLREFWERFRNRIEGPLEFPDFDVAGIEPVRRLKDGPPPPLIPGPPS